MPDPYSFEIVSPLGSTVYEGVPVRRESLSATPPITQRGLGAVLAFSTFGAGFCEPSLRWAWQHRHLIVRDAPNLSTIFPNNVRLSLNENPHVPLPWHVDSFTVLYILALMVQGKQDSAEDIRDVSDLSDETALALIREIFDHSEEMVLGDCLSDDIYDW